VNEFIFRHTEYLQFGTKPDKPDPVYARKLQELIDSTYGEMSVANAVPVPGLELPDA